MALLEQLKNFIRHGKSGKDMKPRDSGSSSGVSSKSKSRTGSRNVSPSRLAGEHLHSTSASSSSAALNQQDIAAGAAAANFNHNSANTEAASRIVAEERHQKSKMPNYPGLERYRLVEKMGE